MNNSIKFDIALKATKAIADLKRLQKVAQSTQKNMNGLNKVTANYARNTKKVSDANRGASVSFAKLTSSMVSGNLIAGAISSTFRGLTSIIFAAGSKAITSAAEFETLGTQLEVLTGNAGTAKKLFQDLVEFSNITPFEPEVVVKAGKTLLAFGLTADETRERIKSLGDISAVSGKPLTDLARIFGQIQTQGKLTAERLNQLTDAGINLGPEISKSMGIAEKDFRKFVSQGKVTSEETIKAFDKLTQEGGRFFQGTIKLSKTASGIMSTLRGQTTFLAQEFGTKLLPVLKIVGIEISKLLVATIKWVQENLTLKDVVKGTMVFIDALTNGVVGLVRVFNMGTAGTKFFLAGILDLVSIGSTALKQLIKFQKGAVNVLTFGLAGFFKGLEKEKAQIKFLGQVAENTSKTSEELNASGQKNLEENAKIIDKIKEQAEKLKALISEKTEPFVGPVKPEDQASNDQEITKELAEKASLDRRKENYRIFVEKKNELLLAGRIAETELELASSIQNEETQTSRMQKLIEQLGLEQAIKFEARLRNAENLRESSLIELEIEAEGSRRKLELLRTEQSEKERAISDFYKFVENEAKDDARKQKKIADKKKADEKNNREVLVNGTVDMFGSLAQVSALGGKKLFKITKAFNLAEAVTAGVLSVQKAAASAPPPYNIPAIVSATATSVANVARIASQKAPAFEQGGIVPGNSFSGDKVAARVNSGEMILNKAQQQNMFRMLQGGGSTSVNSNVVVEIDGEAIGRAVSKQVANGLELGEVI